VAGKAIRARADRAPVGAGGHSTLVSPPATQTTSERRKCGCPVELVSDQMRSLCVFAVEATCQARLLDEPAPPLSTAVGMGNRLTTGQGSVRVPVG